MTAGRKPAGPVAPWRSETAAGTAELQTCIRDLMSLIALPALTVGSDPHAILLRFAEALGSLLPLRFCVIGAHGFDGDAPIVSRWLADGDSAAPLDPPWQRYGDRCMQVKGSQLQQRRDATPIGTMQVVSLAMGYGGETGTLTVGCDDADFPSLTQAAVLRAAASLAAGRLKAARLALEREQASQVKDEFLAMLGHELRNPLSPIVTALDLMRLRSPNQTATREQLIIRRQVDHLIRLVDDLMDVSRITRGKVELRSATVEISSVLNDAVEMVSLLLEQRRHRLSLDFPPSGLLWTGDPTRLAQVVSNLLTNAARYTRPGGEIALHARRDGGTVEIGVRDNGIGMDGALLPRVFDMFHQGARTYDRAEGGLGLGLALVKSLVALHGGSVEAHSDGPDRGSQFIVRLPLPMAAVDSGAPAAAGAAPASRLLRILLVDDNIDSADALAAFLASLGHTVLAIHDPVSALRRCVDFAPQLALLDIGMPVMDGYELATRLRALPAMNQVRLIAMTGYGRDRDPQQSRQSSFDAFLVKPLHTEALLELIERFDPNQTAASAALR